MDPVFIPIVAITMTLSIPLAAIIGSFYLKAKKLSIGQGLSDKDKMLFNKLLAENSELKKRVETLELLSDTNPAQLPDAKEEELQKQINFLANEISALKSKND